MRFFDCNCHFGAYADPRGKRAVDVDGLLGAMDAAGIDKALVWHVAQRDADPLTGNDILAGAIAPHERLVGCWALLPPQTGEMGRIEDWFAAAFESRVRAVTAWPDVNRFLLRAEVFGGVFEEMIARRVPLLYRCQSGATGGTGENWTRLYDLLRDFPELTVILCGVGCWGPDRLFRPLLDAYANVYLETSEYILDGGIEAFVERYGGARLLYGSDFPAAYHGGMMLALAHAEISDDAKRAIASGNLERLTGEVRT